MGRRGGFCAIVFSSDFEAYWVCSILVKALVPVTSLWSCGRDQCCRLATVLSSFPFLYVCHRRPPKGAACAGLYTKPMGGPCASMTGLLHDTVIVKWGLRGRRSPQREISLTDGLWVWFLHWLQDSLDLSSLSLLLWSFLGKKEHRGLSGAAMTREKPYV